MTEAEARARALIPALIRKCLEAKARGADSVEVWGDGSPTREFLYVGDAAEGILQAAKTRGCDLIVLASHGRRGFERALLGSQASRVLTHSSVPVLICK